MKFPNKVIIGGVPYAIWFDTDSFDSETEHLGCIKYKQCEIVISANMPEEIQMQTLIHEWVHGALFAIGYDDLRSDEKLVQNLAMQINQAFILKQEAENEQNPL